MKEVLRERPDQEANEDEPRDRQPREIVPHADAVEEVADDG